MQSVQPFRISKTDMLKHVLRLHFLECCEYQADDIPDDATTAKFIEKHFDDFEDAVIDFVGNRFSESNH